MRYLCKGRVVYAARNPVGRLCSSRAALLTLKVALRQAQAQGDA